MNLGVIIQARVGSSRYPEKVIRPFYKTKSILDIIIEVTKTISSSIVVATSTQVKNESIVDIAKRHNISYYQGDEENVLSRFIHVIKKYGFTHVIRICADNPFLSKELALLLLKKYDGQSDYCSYLIQGKPAILTHYGLFCEIIKASSLLSLSETNDKDIKEHVTISHYTSELYETQWVNEDTLNNLPNFRLTVDTPEDFQIAQKIYALLDESGNHSISNLVSLISTTKMSQEFQSNILNNTK